MNLRNSTRTSARFCICVREIPNTNTSWVENGIKNSPKENDLSVLADGRRLFTRACNDTTRGNVIKLKENRFRFDLGKKFFIVRVL